MAGSQETTTEDYSSTVDWFTNTSSSTSDTVLANTTSYAIPEFCVIVTSSLTYIPWDNPENLVSLQAQQMVKKTYFVFIPILLIIGIPSNVLNMAVFAKQGLKERINLCVFFQSLADFVYLTHTLLLQADRIYLESIGDDSDDGIVSQFLMKNNLLFISGVRQVSIFATTVIAVERCFCVVSPLKSRRLLHTRTMLVILLVGTVVILAVSYVICLQYSTLCVFNPMTRTTKNQAYPSAFAIEHEKLIQALEGYFSSVFLPWTFCSVVTITTAITVHKIRQMKSFREATSSATTSQREIALTRMLVGCSVLLLVCYLPLNGTVRVWILAEPRLKLGGRWNNLYVVLHLLMSFMTVINSTFNFFIYMSLGRKFRETLRSIFCCCTRRSQSDKITMTIMLSENEGNQLPKLLDLDKS